MPGALLYDIAILLKQVSQILHNCIYAHFRKLAQEKRLRSKVGQTSIESENPIETLLLEKNTG